MSETSALISSTGKITRAGTDYLERQADPHAKKKRAQMMSRALRKLGYQVTITPINHVTAINAM